MPASSEWRTSRAALPRARKAYPGRWAKSSELTGLFDEFFPHLSGPRLQGFPGPVVVDHEMALGPLGHARQLGGEQHVGFFRREAALLDEPRAAHRRWRVHQH